MNRRIYTEFMTIGIWDDVPRKYAAGTKITVGSELWNDMVSVIELSEQVLAVNEEEKLGIPLYGLKTLLRKIGQISRNDYIKKRKNKNEPR